jgi:hypothetical protein
MIASFAILRIFEEIVIRDISTLVLPTTIGELASVDKGYKKQKNGFSLISDLLS